LEIRENKHVNKEKKTKRDALLRILKKLVDRPAYPRELQKDLSLTRSAVYYHVKRLVMYGLAKQLKDGRYAFINYFDVEEAIIQAIREWKRVAFRYPTPAEIANEVGMITQDVEKHYRKAKEKTGWSIPNQAILESAAEKLGEVLVCATRIRDGKISSFDYEQDPEIFEKANAYPKKHPEMLPQLDGDGQHVVSWPQSALKYLGRIYKPKDRLKAVLMSS
jgi:DNA-binding transcriptional ArsR family regulator